MKSDSFRYKEITEMYATKIDDREFDIRTSLTPRKWYSIWLRIKAWFV